MHTINTLLTDCGLDGPCGQVPADAGSPGAPHSVWIAPAGAVKTPITETTTLPVWALETACAEYAPCGGSLALLHGPGSQHTDHAPVPTPLAPDCLQQASESDWPTGPRPRLELVVVLDEPAGYGRAEQHHDTAFYTRIREALAPGAIALVHTRTTPGPDGLCDPASAILPSAQEAGLTYLQHIVIVHTRLDVTTSPRWRPPAGHPAAPACRQIHTDLYVLRAPDGGPR